MAQRRMPPRLDLPQTILHSYQDQPGSSLGLEQFLCPDTFNGGLRLAMRPHTAPQGTTSFEDAPLAAGDRSTLRRRPHIRRRLSDTSPLDRPRRASAPPRVPPMAIPVAGPSTLRQSYNPLLVDGKGNPISALPKARPKPQLSHIVTSDLVEVPKMRMGSQIHHPQQRSQSESRPQSEAIFSHASVGTSYPQFEANRNPHSMPNVLRKSSRRARKSLPVPPMDPIASRESSRDPPSRQDTSATIWSQPSAPPTGTPPSRHTSLFITLTSPPSKSGLLQQSTLSVHPQPPELDLDFEPAPTPLPSKNRLQPLVDWSKVDAILRETVITPSSRSVTPTPSIHRSERADSTGTTGSSSSDDSSMCATPQTASPPSPAARRLPGTVPHRSAALGLLKVGQHEPMSPPKPRYHGSWGRAATPSPTGDGITIGDMLMERWARAHAAQMRAEADTEAADDASAVL